MQAGRLMMGSSVGLKVKDTFQWIILKPMVLFFFLMTQLSKGLFINYVILEVDIRSLWQIRFCYIENHTKSVKYCG